MQNYNPNKCECTSYEQKKIIYFQIHICHAFIFREHFRPIMFILPPPRLLLFSSLFLASKFTYDDDTKYVCCWFFFWLLFFMQPLSSTVTPSHTESFPFLLSFFNFTVEVPTKT